MSEEARPATPEDLAVLDALHRGATEELRSQRGGRVWALDTGRDGGSGEPDHFDLRRDDQRVLAGTIDGVVVGYARVLARELAEGGELAVLTDIYVEPDARGVGVGETLLTAAVGWARRRGCIGIDSVALPGMRESKNFFESAGMVARAIIVHRALP